MSHSTTTTTPAFIGPEFLSLVDIDGHAVPVGEKDIPEITRDPTDAADWPAWTDASFYGTLEDLPPDEDLDIPAPDAPDDRPSWSSHFADMLARGIVAPIAGGAPDFEPSAEDLADYHAWSEDLDRRRDTPELIYGYE